MTRLLLTIRLNPGEDIHIDGDEHHYLARVRRHTVGDPVELRDIDGAYFAGTVARIDRDTAVIRVGAQQPARETTCPVHLLVAVPRGTLFDEVVRRLTEIGVARLTPLICERSILIPGEGREARWRRISDEATRQCGRSAPMQIDNTMPFDQIVSTVGADQRWLLHPAGESAAILQTRPQVHQGALVAAIGPEGGFTPREIAVAAASEFVPIRLGRNILRIETAAVVAASLFVSFVGGMD